MAFSAEMFSNFAKDAECILSALGFHRTTQEMSDAFGSHSVRYEKDQKAILLIWDGKEEWLTIRSQHSHEEIFFRKLGTASSEAEYQSAMKSALATLQHYFSSSHDHDEDGHCCGHHHA